MTDQEFIEQCRKIGVDPKDHFHDPFLRNLFFNRVDLDSLFYEVVEKFKYFVDRDNLIQSNDKLPTVCSVFRFIEECSKDNKTIKYIPWASIIGQKMAKRMATALEEYKNEKNLYLGQDSAKVS